MGEMNDFQIIRDARGLAAQLRMDFPDSNEALADTIDGEVSITDALYRLLISAEDDRTTCAALSTRISELEERRGRIERGMERKRALVLMVMQECGIKKIERPELTASVVPSPPKVIITDEPSIPEAYLRTKIEPNKSEILRALKAGEEVPGTLLSNPSSHLTIKRG
jgi:hypothetical protein